MSSLAELPELVGFFSYSREDDEAFKGMLSALRHGIQRELSAQLGRTKRTFRLWQDVAAIAPGKLWESEIKSAIDGSFFFIPIVTPRSVSSKYCEFEFKSFLAREKAIGRSDLVFPVLYISVAALENEAKWRKDVVLSTIGRRQYVDWRPLRHLDAQTTAVREQIERLCQKIVEALNEPWVPPEERRRMEEAEARQRAEEEARRLDAEAKRRAEEEQHRKQEEAKARQRAEEERRRQKAEAKRLADEDERRKRAEAEARQRAEQERERQAAEAPNHGSAEAGRWRVGLWPLSSPRAAIGAAAVVVVLLLAGWAGYAYIQTTIEQTVQQREAEFKAELERQAIAVTEAEAKRKAEETEQQRLAAVKAEQERLARAAAEAEAKRKTEEAERQRLATYDGYDTIVFKGLPGGPFQPGIFPIRLGAIGGDMRWTAESNSPAWLNISPTAGTIPAGRAVELKVSTSEGAKVRSPGTYEATIWFKGHTGDTLERRVQLVITAELERQAIAVTEAEAKRKAEKPSNSGWQLLRRSRNAWQELRPRRKQSARRRKPSGSGSLPMMATTRLFSKVCQAAHFSLGYSLYDWAR